MVRLATDEDIVKLVKLVMEFNGDFDHIKCAGSISRGVIANRIKDGIALGLCFLAVEDGSMDPHGVILGNVDRNVWSDDLFEITLLAQYVKPRYRRGVTGGRLFKAYMDRADELLEADNKIKISCLMAQPSGTNIKMEKHGFKLMQTTYFKE